MSVAADRIFGNAERRTEHARFGEAASHGMRQREHEETRGAELRGKGREAGKVRLQLFELFGAAHADQQPRAGTADDAQRATRVDVAGREGERVEHGETFTIVQLAAERGRRLTYRDAPRVVFAADFDIDQAGFLPLPDAAGLARARHASARQHEVSCNGRVADEAGFGARCKEAHAQLVIGAIGFEDERGVGVVELAGDGEHLGIGEESASSTTPAGLPVKRSGVNASTWKMRMRRFGGRLILPATDGTQGRDFR